MDGGGCWRHTVVRGRLDGHGYSGAGQPLGADRRRQVLRLGAPAALAGGGALSRLRRRYRGSTRLRRDPTAPAALPLQGLRGALRRPHRHGAGRPPSAASSVDPVPVPHGAEPREPADRRGVGAGHIRRAGHDGGAARRPGRQGPAGAAGGRGRDRRGLRRGRPQGPAGRRRPKGRLGRRRRLKAAPGRGALEKDKPPVLGLIQRGGQLVLRMLADVRQKTIRPIIEAAVAEGTRVHTDEYASYARLPAWGYRHVTVCHAHGEYARDEDGDGFCEVHVNTMEGTWSLLRSWLRPHRGISQDKLPLYLRFFEFVHNARRRGRALLGALAAALVG